MTPAEIVGSRPVIASISGGKDSTALALHLREIGIPFRAVFMDTGWEHPATIAYIRDVLDPLFGPIDIIRSTRHPGGMADLIRKKAAFPWRLGRFCTTELKFRPIQEYIEAVSDEEDCEPINAVGIRRGESKIRSRALEWEWSADLDCEVWRPLVNWTLDDVIQIHQRHGVRPNPLYLEGASRVGCWPCIFARKREIRLVADLSPERIETIRELEAALGLTYFHGRAGRRTIGIDDAVAWARTGRGGWPLSDEDEEPGCVRWGLCDTGVPVQLPLFRSSTRSGC